MHVWVSCPFPEGQSPWVPGQGEALMPLYGELVIGLLLVMLPGSA